MSLFTRVASFTAFSFCMLSLGSITTPGKAAELTTTLVPTTMVPATPPIPPMPGTTLPGTMLPDSATIVAPATRFASLEDAVAAQNEGTGASTDVACLASAIYFESKGEPLSGQLAVANVILNRARSGRFPANVCGVVTQPGQFSFVRAGRVPIIAAAARGYRTAIALARVALTAAWDSAAPKALFFHARRVGMGRGTQIAAIGNHIFYR